MKLSVNLFTAFDGVSQAPGSPGEDTRGGFTRGGWLRSSAPVPESSEPTKDLPMR